MSVVGEVEVESLREMGERRLGCRGGGSVFLRGVLRERVVFSW